MQDPASTTPEMATEMFNRAKATEGLDAMRRWTPPLRDGLVLHSTIWSTETRRQIIAVWRTDPDHPGVWTFDRLVDVPDMLASANDEIWDEAEAQARLAAFFEEHPCPTP